MTASLSAFFANGEELLELVVETAHEGIWVLDAQGRTAYVNAQMAGMLGYAESEIVGRVPVDFLDEAARAEWRAHFDRWRAGESERHDFCWRRRDNTPLWTMVSASPIRDREGRFIGALGMLADITERTQAERALRASESRLQLALEATSEGLRELSARLRTRQEEERTRISREIHDELGQLLTAIRMDLRWFEKHLDGVEGADARLLWGDKLGGTVGLVDDLIKGVQNIAAELRPAILDNLGLATAISYEAARFERRADLRCHVQPCVEATGVSPEVSTALFRIFQEILTNVARHAAATQVTVQLEHGLDDVRLTVADNGRGISAEELANVTSLGLLGMRERASLLGGTVTLAGAPGAGTTVTVRIPRHGRGGAHP